MNGKYRLHGLSCLCAGFVCLGISCQNSSDDPPNSDRESIGAEGFPESELAGDLTEDSTEIVTTKSTSKIFGTLQDGRVVEIHRLMNRQGAVVRVMDFGATLVSVEVAGRGGDVDNIVLGFDSLDSYLGDHPYFGVTVGRCCNRIAGSRFDLDGETFQLSVNEGPNQLHGGVRGFDKALWSSEKVDGRDFIGVRFRHVSQDGDQGYPGEMTVNVTYTLNDANELRIEYEAHTDKPTICNLTNHAYWNLRGEGTILEHQLRVNSDRYLQTGIGLIPTGDFVDVEGTPFDFREFKSIGSRIDKVESGYDLCYVLKKTDRAYDFAAEVYEPITGRTMQVLSDQPGLQLYTGNFIAPMEGSFGVRYDKHSGFCLEAQNFPDAIHHPAFPSPILRPDKVYRQLTVHRFSVR